MSDRFFNHDTDISKMSEFAAAQHRILRCHHRNRTKAEWLREHSYEYKKMPAFCDGQARCDDCGVWFDADGRMI